MRVVETLTKPRTWYAFLAMMVAGLAAGPGIAGEPAPDPKLWDATVDKAVTYFRKTQAADGSWGGQNAMGVTGLALTALLKNGKVPVNDPTSEKALKYIESLINPKAGHIAGKDPRLGLQNYVTSINVLALTTANRDSYKAVIGDASKFLRKLQWDEEEGKTPKDDFYGGAGYDSKSRPDLSNTQLFLDALVAAGIPKNDPAFEKARLFVTRCQNLKGEGNDQKWADKQNDGSFIYSPAAGGQTKVQDEPGADGSLPGYGSMTYAGVKSLIYCGVSKDDPRVLKANEWIRKHYTLEINPGMPEPRKHWGLYYYYHTMAKCLDVQGVDVVVDAAGKKHDWRAELTAELAKRQRSDGSWVNDQDKWMEGDPQLVTAYALMTLSYCKPKK
jgi:squalene-hopene/tetraprenyl-beta-curcumene cyclase